MFAGDGRWGGCAQPAVIVCALHGDRSQHGTAGGRSLGRSGGARVLQACALSPGLRWPREGVCPAARPGGHGHHWASWGLRTQPSLCPISKMGGRGGRRRRSRKSRWFPHADAIPPVKPETCSPRMRAFRGAP